MKATTTAFLLLHALSLVNAFVTEVPSSCSRKAAEPAVVLPRLWAASSTFSVSASELEKDLSQTERTIVGVVRQCGPSVAFVTSVWPSRPDGLRPPEPKKENELPRGQSLGSGSGFVVDSRGYLVTNYHVIERAYQIEDTVMMMNKTLDRLGLSPFLRLQDARPLPQVFVRINSSTKYLPCEIVDVEPDLDVAVLRILNMTGEDLKPMQFGSSSKVC